MFDILFFFKNKVLVLLLKNSYKLDEIIDTACDKLSELFTDEVFIVNKKSTNLRSWFDNPEFSGPNNIAVLGLILICLLNDEKLLIIFFSKNLCLLVVPITKLKFSTTGLSSCAITFIEKDLKEKKLTEESRRILRL